jgi:hypothetical protein
MKVSKAGVWVCLVLAAIFAVIGVVLFVVKPASGPIVVSKDLEAWTTTSGYLVIDGKLKNDSDEELTITYIEIEVTTDGPTQVIYLDYYNLDEDEDPADYVLAPGEEFNLSGYGVGCSYDAHTLTICKVTVNGTEYTVYENMSAMTVFGVAMFIFAIVFIACALSTLVKAKKEQKKYNDFADALMHSEGNGVLVGGTYAQKGEAGKAAAKTAASAVGGALSAAFLGVGFYKVYGGNAQRIFVVTDDGLYVGVNNKGALALANMNFIAKGTFGDCNVSTNKKQVILTNNVTAETFRFNTANSNVTAEQLSERLRELVEYKPEPVAPVSEASPADSNPSVEDPFKDL